MRFWRCLTWQQTSHNLEVAGSNPAPATRKAPETGLFSSERHRWERKLLPNFCPASNPESRQAEIFGVEQARLYQCRTAEDPERVEENRAGMPTYDGCMAIDEVRAK